MSPELRFLIRLKYDELRENVGYVQIAEDEDRAEFRAEKDHRGILKMPLLRVQRPHHSLQAVL